MLNHHDLAKKANIRGNTIIIIFLISLSVPLPFLTQGIENITQQVTAGQCQEWLGSETKVIKLSWFAPWTPVDFELHFHLVMTNSDSDSSSDHKSPCFFLSFSVFSFSFRCPVRFISSPQSPAKYLLPEVSIADYGKNCVVIDLDETLVHSSFKVNRTLFNTVFCRKNFPLGSFIPNSQLRFYIYNPRWSGRKVARINESCYNDPQFKNEKDVTLWGQKSGQRLN